MPEQASDRPLDLIGIGAGPANLSLAALLGPVGHLSYRFLEQRSSVSWHPGLLLPGAKLQVSFAKDLVTPVDPTNPNSFLSFLVRNKRFYRFTAAGSDRPSRAEFNQYLRWVASRLPSVQLGRRVDAVDHRAGLFAVHSEGDVYTARSVVLGTGPAPYVPECARRHLGTTVFHASDYAFLRPDSHQRVAVVGGGQSSAEVFLDLLDNRCRDLVWITRRSNLLPLDESPFTNELFAPNYALRFFAMDAQIRRDLLLGQRLASDGISTELLQQIYERLNQLDYTGEPGWPPPVVRPQHELIGLERATARWRLALRDVNTGRIRTEVADTVVLATGYLHQLPDFLEPLRGRVHYEGGYPVVRSDFSLACDGSDDASIYVQNAAKHSHGIADSNLSLLAWRSAVIINSVLNKGFYDVEDVSSAITWEDLYDCPRMAAAGGEERHVGAHRTGLV